MLEIQLRLQLKTINVDMKVKPDIIIYQCFFQFKKDIYQMTSFYQTSKMALQEIHENLTVNITDEY